jgi:hypothetical protein
VIADVKAAPPHERQTRCGTCWQCRASLAAHGGKQQAACETGLLPSHSLRQRSPRPPAAMIAGVLLRRALSLYPSLSLHTPILCPLCILLQPCNTPAAGLITLILGRIHWRTHTRSTRTIPTPLPGEGGGCTRGRRKKKVLP